MITTFHDDYVGPFDATYKEKLADYEDTIKELIGIEQGGRYYEPPQMPGMGTFYNELKVDVQKRINLSFKDDALNKETVGLEIFAWIIYFSFDDPQVGSANYAFS